MEHISGVFERRTSRIKRMVGAIDCSHIKVHPKQEEQGLYINRKQYCSVLLSAVCDHRCFFMAVDTGFPGKMGDSRALQYTSWKNAMRMFGNAGYFLYGDAGCPLKRWLLAGYRNLAKCTQDQLKFNTHGSRGRVIIGCAFGKLKG